MDTLSIPPVKRSVYSLPQGGEAELKTQEWALPVGLSFYQTKETLLLQRMISEVNGYLLQFKLAPAYSLYMVVKHHLAPEFQPGMSSSERRKCLLLTIKSIISQIKRAVKVCSDILTILLEQEHVGNEIVCTVLCGFDLYPPGVGKLGLCCRSSVC